MWCALKAFFTELVISGSLHKGKTVIREAYEHNYPSDRHQRH